jgi:hypothetical protein
LDSDLREVRGLGLGLGRPKSSDIYDSFLNFVLYTFQFKSYCCSHRPSQKVHRQQQPQNSTASSKCSICQEAVCNRPTPRSLWSPCCSAWLHRSCVQSMALNAGEHHFKCPLCNDKDKFIEEMHSCGIYLPTRDASWEQDGNFYDQHTVGENVNSCPLG